MIFFQKKDRKKKRKQRLSRIRKIFKPSKSKYLVFTPKEIFQTAAGLFFIVLGVLFFTSSFFKIKRIECLNLNFPCSSKEIELFTPLLGKNIFFTSVNKLKNKLKKADYKIREVKIKRVLPDKIIAEFFFRMPAANLTLDQKEFYIVDNKGFIFEKKDKPFPNLPVVLFEEKLVLSTGVFFKGKVENILELVSQLKRKLINSNLIRITGVDAVTLTLDQEVLAILSARRKFSEQLDSLQLILSRSKIEGKLPKKIDLRFEKPIVVY